MSSMRGPVRVLVLLWAALQLALPGVAALADAFASRDGATATAHVEDASGSSCVRVHDTECVFCQLLSTCASPTRSPMPEGMAVRGVAVADRAAAAPAIGSRLRELLPRAPPRA